MLDTLLFDLDGTLLPINTNNFIKDYFKLLAMHCRDIMDPNMVAQLVMKATYQVIADQSPEKTNELVFTEEFEKSTGIDRHVFMPVFEEFYRSAFTKLESICPCEKRAVEAIKVAKSKGYCLVLATNPIFPEIAVEHRMRWAGLNKEDFCIVTVFENSHFCKPSIRYYEEILQKLGKKPEQCMMIGNDGNEDVIAGKLGMKTFLVTDFLIPGSEQLKPDYTGDYDDLLDFIKELKPIR